MQKERISPEELRRLRRIENILWWLQMAMILLVFLSILFVAATSFLWVLWGCMIALAVAVLFVRYKYWRCPECGELLPWLWCAVGVLHKQKREFCPGCGVALGLGDK